MNKQLNLQDSILNYVRKEHIPVTIFLTNGFQFRGNVIGFDNFIIIIDCESRQQMVYKHAVSTVVPAKNIQMDKFTSSGEQDE